MRPHIHTQWLFMLRMPHALQALPSWRISISSLTHGGPRRAWMHLACFENFRAGVITSHCTAANSAGLHSSRTPFTLSFYHVSTAARRCIPKKCKQCRLFMIVYSQPIVLTGTTEAFRNRLCWTERAWCRAH
ncbi:hypothetical protein BKA93DRAFT_764120 [Sparassis latifolia]